MSSIRKSSSRERVCREGREGAFGSVIPSIHSRSQAHCLIATFGKDISPMPAKGENLHKDRRGLRKLAIHMITRNADEPEDQISRQKMLLIGGAGIDAKFKPSPEFVDFLLLCVTDEVDMGRLSKVSGSRTCWPLHMS